MIKRLLITFLFAFCTIYSYAAYPTINQNRPRIYADSSRIAYLKNKVKVEGECKTMFNEFKAAYDGWWINDPQLYLLGNDSTKWNWDWSSQWSGAEAFYTAFLFKVTDDTLALKRCRFIAGQVSKYIDTINFAKMEWYAKENLLRQMSDAGDILLDWCYEALPYNIRAKLALSLYAMNREFMNTFIYSSSGNSYVSSHNTWNNIFCNQNALTLYNAVGLSPFQKDTVTQWFKAVYDKHINGFIPCWTYYRDDDGGWNWGAAYAMWSLMDQFQLFENMRIGTNKNFYKDLPWIKNSINQYVYFIQPNNICIHLGDGETALASDRTMYLHARIYNDQRSLYMAQTWSQPKLAPNTNQKFAILLYKDFDMPKVEKPVLPLDWFADKVGLSVSRSSWDSSSTMVTFFNSPSKRAAHEHRDNNSFIVFKYAPLLIDAGYYDTYGGTHYNNYYQRTIAHNSICVFDSTDKYGCFGKDASNDGGQIESAALMNYDEIFLPANQRGKWIKYATGDNYSYNVADAQLSYDSTKLDFFRRKLLYIKPNRILNLDYIHLKNVGTKQRDIQWIAHFAKKPVVSGNIISSKVKGHIDTYSGNNYTASNGAGTVGVRTCLPQNTTTTLVGGASYEYWVNGQNYPPLTPPDTTYHIYTPGTYRIEVRPKTVTDSIVFLHTIEVSDTSKIAQPSGLGLMSGNSVGVDWRDTLYFFAAKPDTILNYHYFDTVLGERNLGLFAADLIPGEYFIKVDGVSVAKMKTDSSGILQGSTLLDIGLHKVEIVATDVSVKGEAGNSGLELYPNPARGELNVRIDEDIILVEIYDSLGKLELISNAKSGIDVSKLAKGVYIVKIKTGNKERQGKFTKE